MDGAPRPTTPQPPEDDDCCGSGCAVCVWDLYADRLETHKARLEEWNRHRKCSTEALSDFSKRPQSKFVLQWIDGGGSTAPDHRMASYPCWADDPSRLHFHSDRTSVYPVVAKQLIRGSSMSLEHAAIHMELELGHSSTGSVPLYHPGDTFWAWVPNPAPYVKRIAQALGLELNAVFTLEPNKDSPIAPFRPFPLPCSVEKVLTWYVDLVAAPTSELLQRLSRFTDCLTERQKMCDTRFMSQYKGIAVVDLFDLFPSLTRGSNCMTLEHLVSDLEPSRFRPYTISSCRSANSSRLSLTVAVQPAWKADLCSDNAKLQKRCGLFSGLLASDLAASCSSSDYPILYGEGPLLQVKGYVSPSSFRHPPSLSAPLVLICAGTGIAPFRGFMQHRICQIQHHSPDQLNIGEAVLFFGCRDKDDLLYSDDMSLALQLGALSAMHVAYSRLPNEPRTYVQDFILGTHADHLRALIVNRGAHVYICGAKSMGLAVHNALETTLAGNFEQVVREGRLLQEVW